MLRKVSIICWFLIQIPIFITAQENNPPFYRDKTTIKLSYKPHKENKEIYHNYGIEGSYGINKWLDVGAFMTYRYFEKQNIQNGNTTTLSINYFKYGAGCNIHVLPLFCDPEYYAFDVYISPRIGIFTALYDKRLSDLDKHVYNGFLYLASLGVAWNFIKNVGIFCEGEYERFDKFGFKAGINIRF